MSAMGSLAEGPQYENAEPASLSRRPVLDTGARFFGYVSALIHSSRRSRQSGFSASITANFQSRRHYLTSYSQAMVGSISSWRLA